MRRGSLLVQFEELAVQMEIQSILKSPENHYRVFVKEISDPRILVKDMIAFSNTKGGEIVVGVDKKNNIINGIDIIKDLEKINFAATKLCNPVVSPVVQFYTIENKIICLIEIPSGTNKPYYCGKNEDVPEMFIRSGNKSILADSMMEKEVTRQGQKITLDRLSMKSLSAGVIEKQYVKKYLHLRKQSDLNVTEANMESLGILGREGNEYFPTVGGVLLFAKDPQKIQRLQQAVIKCARFQGTSIESSQSHKIIFRGTLPEQVNSAMGFISEHSASDKLSSSDYPLSTVREAVTNAVIHRDYFYADSMAISIAIFDDRVEIRSPGILTSGINIEQLGKKQVSRNPFISKVMFEMGFFSDWGGGIKKIRENMDQAGFIPPEFAELEKKFKATLYFRGKQSGPVKSTINALDELIEEVKVTGDDSFDLGKEYNRRQLRALKLIKKTGEITNKKYRFAFKVSNKTAYLELKELFDDQLIVKKGSGRSTTYKIPNF